MPTTQKLKQEEEAQKLVDESKKLIQKISYREVQGLALESKKLLGLIGAITKYENRGV
ncbi:MAG: hypothetical protein ACP5H8_01660 [Candidatus Micrarchaeia archaeon]